jgi:hypothetical protein
MENNYVCTIMHGILNEWRNVVNVSNVAHKIRKLARFYHTTSHTSTSIDFDACMQSH